MDLWYDVVKEFKGLHRSVVMLFLLCAAGCYWFWRLMLWLHGRGSKKQKEQARCPFQVQEEKKMLLSFCSDIPTSESRLGSCRWQPKSPGGATVSDAKRHWRDTPVTSEASTCNSKYSIYCFVTNNRLWQALTTQFVSCAVVLGFCCLLLPDKPFR